MELCSAKPKDLVFIPKNIKYTQIETSDWLSSLTMKHRISEINNSLSAIQIGNAIVTLLILTESFWLSWKGNLLAMKGGWFVTASVYHWDKQNEVQMASVAVTAPAKCSLCSYFDRPAMKQWAGKNELPFDIAPQGHIEPVRSERTVSKLIYLNWHSHFLSGSSGEHEVGISCSVWSHTSETQVADSVGWKDKLRHSRTIYFHSLRDTFSRKVQWVDTKIHPITAWTFPCMPIHLLTVSWPEPSPSSSSSSWPWFWIGFGRKVWRKQRGVV